MVDISRETNERNGVETIIDSNGILWLNERHAKDGLNHEKSDDYRKIYFRSWKT